MDKLIVLNHKTHLEYDEIYNYIDKINNFNTKNNLIICPSNIYLETFINNCNWGIGAQNVYYKRLGDYTGEISSIQLKSLGIEYSMVGHYERKKYFKETDRMTNKKLIACLESNICPILCFGESGVMDDVINNLDELLKGIDNINFIIFAYEPLKLDYVKDAKEILKDINFIYNYLSEKYKVKPNIIYGGGIDEDNIEEIIKIDKLNGLLIGSKSSNIDKIIDLISIVE